jgi:arylsulfatase A-like enzyme
MDRLRFHRQRAQRRRRAAAFELLERRDLLTSTPTIELTRDRSSPGFNFVFSGQADPLSTVTVGQASGGQVGQAVADLQGNWSVSYRNAQLAGGGFRFSAVASDALGNVSDPSPLAMYRPNLVLVNTDDMAAHDLGYMPLVNQLLVDSGTTFNNSFVTTSVSGPSRASLLTGQYAHSNGVFDALSPLGGEVNTDYSSTIATWLHDSGYRTAAFGKSETYFETLESSHPTDPPPGWDEFSVRNDSGFVYDRDGNDTVIPFDPTQNTTDMWASMSNSFLQAPRSEGTPFFLYMAPIISHQPYAPLPRDAGSLNGLTPWRPPSYNIVPPDVTNLSPTTNVAGWDLQRQRHLETLQAVDDAIGSLYDTLSQTGDLDNTVFVFTADNGLMWGEHALFSTKDNFYDESLRVPLVVRDGRLPAARTADQLALNIDLAPTFASLAGVAPATPVDGLDLSPAVYGSNETLRSAFVMEHNWTPGWAYLDRGYGTGGVGIRTETWKYVEYQSGKRDLFNLASDPYEMHNLGDDPDFAAQRQQLAAQLQTMLPSDKTGPVITSTSQHVEFDSAGLPYLRVQGTVSDATTGNSQIRSPEYFVDASGTQGWGWPLDTADGSFNSPTEPFRGKVPPSLLATLAAGSHSFLVQGRDVPGNWGSIVPLPFTLLAGPQLDPASDTGDSNSDGLTINSTPRIFGTTTPNATLSLFTVNDGGDVVAIGSAIADGEGKWTATVALPAGEQSVFAIVADPTTFVRNFTAALPIHVMAAENVSGQLDVVGTEQDDSIVVDASVVGIVSITFNGVAAGVMAWSGQLLIEGLDGNDSLVLNGDLPAILQGGDGDDVLQGGTNDDILEGNAGANQLSGGPGNDRYRFTVGEDFSVDKVKELAGQGLDTLDFSQLPEPVVVAFGGTSIARYTASAYANRVELAPGSAASFESVLGSNYDDVISVPATIRVTGGAGDDAVNLQTRVNPNASTPLPTFAASYVAGEGTVRGVLTAGRGTLSLNLAIAGGLTASDVQGNGTGQVVVTATRDKVNATLRATSGVVWQLGAASAGGATVHWELFSLSSGVPLEHDTTWAAINSLPVLSLAGSLSFTEQSAPILLAPSASVIDAEGNFAGGNLVVGIPVGASSFDRVAIVHQGTSAGQIGVSGNNISFGGQAIGSFSGGAGTVALRISFTSSLATSAVVQSVARDITFETVGDAPSTAARTISFQVTDGDGGPSASKTVAMNVLAVNDAPQLNTAANPSLPAIQEDAPNLAGTQVAEFASAGISDPDGAVAKGIAVTGVSTSGGKWQFTLNAGASWQDLGAPTDKTARLLPIDATTRVRFLPNLDYNGQVLLYYRAWDQTQGAAGSTFNVVGSLGGGKAFSTGYIGASQAITPVNDKPVLALQGAVTYKKDTTAILTSPNATVADVDSANFSGGRLRVRITDGAAASNRLGIGGNFTVDGSGNVKLAGVAIGKLNTNGGLGTTDLIVVFNSAATPDVAQKLVRSITFKTVAGAIGKRTLLFSVSDGDGGTSTEMPKTINVQ